jgi:Flp pilus assembly pilin Flp
MCIKREKYWRIPRLSIATGSRFVSIESMRYNVVPEKEPGNCRCAMSSGRLDAVPVTFPHKRRFFRRLHDREVTQMLNHLRSLVSLDEAGQTNVEYGMIVTILGVAMIGILTLVGADIQGEYTALKDRLLDVL